MVIIISKGTTDCVLIELQTVYIYLGQKVLMTDTHIE